MELFTATATSKRRTRVVASLLLSSLAIILVLYSIVAPLHPQHILEARHPLSPGQRTALNSKHVRILSFGGRTTAGYGLPSPWLAYPHALSQSVRNVATNDLTLATACTQSIVGDDDAYDLITIETSDIKTTEVLLRRLRIHFPRAEIALLQLWHPSQIRYHDQDGSYFDIHQFRKSRNLSLSDNALYFAMLSETDVKRWSVEHNSDFRRIAHAHKATLHQQTLPPDDIFEFPQTFHQMMSIYDDDSDYLNADGHAIIVDFLRGVVPDREAVFNRNDRDVVLPWGDAGDKCELWYQHGGSSRKRGSFLRNDGVVEFGHEGRLHKHAIEVDKKGREMTIHNPFNEDRMLYLTYMTSGDDLVDRMYPSARISLDESPVVRIDPFHEESHTQELTRTTAVGMVPAGDSLLQIQPLEEAELPFRLVGTSLVSKEIDPTSLDFGFGE